MSNADHLLDRIKLKQQIMRWRTATIFSLLGLVIFLIYQGDSAISLQDSHIARITIEGIITDDPKRDEILENIRDNDRVKAVIVKLDTPGGTGSGGQELYNLLREIAAEKPVVATMRGMATSAGYMTAVAADHIIAQESTITGSVGVIMQTFNLKRLAEEWGIRPITIKSGELKGSPDTFEDMNAKERAVLQDVIDDFNAYFQNLVQTRRQLDAKTMALVGDGRVFSGKHALEIGLVDTLGGEREALEYLEKTYQLGGLEIFDHKPRKERTNLLDKISSVFGGNPMEFPSLGLDGLMLIWQPHATFSTTSN